jgi:GT2 family glycosyltransferase
MAAQTRPPDSWVVVDDGSTDATLRQLRALQRVIPFLRVLEAPQRDLDPRADRLAVAAEARAFNWALAQTAPADLAFVAKLDADIVLEPGHYERLLAEFDADPELGIAGCFLSELHGGRWVESAMPEYHVNGALKMYRAECLEAIGGIEERLAWDTIDETRARMLGWRTRSIRGLGAHHLRPSGSAGGALRGSARHGECVWIVSYPPSIVVLRAMRLTAGRPPRLAGLAFLYGWLRAAIRRRGRVEDAELRAFSRAEQRSRVRSAVRRAVRRA